MPTCEVFFQPAGGHQLMEEYIFTPGDGDTVGRMKRDMKEYFMIPFYIQAEASFLGSEDWLPDFFPLLNKQKYLLRLVEAPKNEGDSVKVPSVDETERETQKWRKFYAAKPLIFKKHGRKTPSHIFFPFPKQGCDGSILLDTTDVMNLSLKGFDHLDIVKSELEKLCPGVVCVLLAGGPLYPLQTGRRDSKLSFYDDSVHFPAPGYSLQDNIEKFAKRVFDERERVFLLVVEKGSPPNLALKGFDHLDITKSQLENLCPGVVSCATLLVLSPRETVLLAGGPFYPLHTGRGDSKLSFYDDSVHFPAPGYSLQDNIEKFAKRVFDERETVSLLVVEKGSPPNLALKGFDHLDITKSELENLCPGVVSCATLLVLSPRETVLLAGGPFYPLHTGRGDSKLSFYDDSVHLPTPGDSLQDTIDEFAKRGFNELETVYLLGAHSTGMNHCKFFQERLALRSRCNNSDSPSASSPSSSPSPSLTSDQDPGMKMDYEGPGSGLLQGRGILFIDQQLMAGNRTADFDRQYASDSSIFFRDFALAMMKLSMTGTKGRI